MVQSREIAVGFLILFAFNVADGNLNSKCHESSETNPVPKTNSTLRQFSDFAIAADSEYCSEIGKAIAILDGSAVDVAISVGLCNGLMSAQSTGIGGGMFMVVYLKDKNKAYSINARETAPQNAYETMFANRSSLVGGLSTGIPGEIAGLWEAYKLGGRLPWKTLFKPAINMCRRGYKVTPIMAYNLYQHEKKVRANPGLSKVFIDQTTNRLAKAGDVVRRPELANTLEIIANNNISAFYSSSLTNLIVEEINENGGNVTLDDFANYRPIVSESQDIDISDELTLHSVPVPSSGVLVAFIMRLMRGYNLTEDIFKSEYETSLFYHRLIESFKFAYAQRSLLGDEDSPEIRQVIENLKSEEYINDIRSRIDDFRTFPSPYYSNVSFVEDHGTCHTSVLVNGDAVSFTGSINMYLGALYAGTKTGIIYNNHMDDFSTPGKANGFGFLPSKVNYIRPGKRPMSSMSPLIITNKKTGQVELVLGAAGGSHIISSVAQIAIKTMFMGKNIKQAIDEPRVHHQLYPEYVETEQGFDPDVQSILRLFGHDVNCREYGGSTCQGIRQSTFIEPYSDPRKGGLPAGF